MGIKTAAFIGTVFMEGNGAEPTRGSISCDSPFHYDAFSPMSGSVFLGATPGVRMRGKDRQDGAFVIRSAKQWLAENKAVAGVFCF